MENQNSTLNILTREELSCSMKWYGIKWKLISEAINVESEIEVIFQCKVLQAGMARANPSITLCDYS